MFATTIKRSKQLPFRFFPTYKEIEDNGSQYTSKVLDAPETVFTYVYENIPRTAGTTLIACDVCGSMEIPISKNSSLERYVIG